MSIFEDDSELSHDQSGNNTTQTTADIISELNSYSSSYEETFNNKITFAIYEEELTREVQLYDITHELTQKLNEGYILNLYDDEFIKNLILLYQYSKNDSLKTLYGMLPAFLKIIINYHNLENTPLHFWIQALTNQLSLKDLMSAFNLPFSEGENIQQDQALLEPYCILLDAALQEFNFDNGKRLKPGIFSAFAESHAIFLELKRTNSPLICDMQKFTAAYPFKYRFLIDTAIDVDYGCFLSGLFILTTMVFGGPSDHFLDKVTHTILEAGAYTVPFCNHSIPRPIVSAFPIITPIFFYVPFIIDTPKYFSAETGQLKQ
ncbi:MAG: hypothetical protein ACJARD_001676 [Alphaproteobacteria bacterium]|jgi:hypothetical protein